MSADILLSLLNGVKKTGLNRWAALCPAHDDKTPSLTVRLLEDERVLLHCFAGCGVEQVLGAVGLDFDALFPEKPIEFPNDRPFVKPERKPVFPADVFGIARREIAVVAVIAADIHAGRAVSDLDYERLFIAAGRLDRIARAAYER